MNALQITEQRVEKDRPVNKMIIVRNYLFFFVFNLTLSLVAGCSGGGAGDEKASRLDSNSIANNNSIDNNSFLIATVRNASGNTAADNLINEQCSSLGGIAIYQGADSDGNGTLEESEYFASTVENQNPKILCHGATLENLSPLLASSVLSVGSSECSTGGYLVSLGFDGNQNTVLDSDEIDSSLALCNNQEPVSSIKYTPTGEIRGQVPLAALNTKSVRSLANSSTRAVKSKTGSLWLSPDAVSSAVRADVKQSNESVPVPLLKPISVPIQADGSYRIPNLLSGSDYRLIYVDGGKTLLLDKITVAPGETKDINILSSELQVPGSISMTVQSSIDNSPIENATVVIHSLNKIVQTNVNGFVQIADLAEGRYGVSIEAQDYVAQYKTLDVRSGQNTDAGTLALNKEFGKLTGTVSVSGLANNSNVIVYARSQDGSLFTALTNANGSYQFPAIPVGDGYSIIASAHDHQTAKVDEVTVYKGMATTAPKLILERSGVQKGSIEGVARFDSRSAMQHAGIIVSIEGTDFEAVTARDGSYVFNHIPVGDYTLNFTDSNHIAQSKNLTVVEAAAKRVEDVVLKAVTAEVSGSVNDDQGNPVENASVVIQSATTTHSAVTDATGVFSVTGVLTGNITITVSKDGYGANAVSDKLVPSGLAIKAPIELTRFTLNGNVQLSGLNDHSGVSVLLTGTGVPSSVTDQQGNFTLYGVKPGQYVLQLTHAGFDSVSQIIDVTSAPFTLPEIITMTPKVGSVAGNLVLPSGFGSPENIEVSLIDTSGTQLAQSTVLNDGSYLLTNILPGDGYIVRVKGTDLQGNTINVVNQANLSVTANTIVSAQDVSVSLTDPNPPVISSVTFTQNLSKNVLGQYVINPSGYTTLSDGTSSLSTPQYIDLSVLAQDADGDVVSYQFTTDFGTIVTANNNQARWLAPDKGGLATISIVAKSNNRTTTQVLEVAVNNYANITYLAPDHIAYPDIYSANVNSLQLTQFTVSVDDFEDGTIPESNIKWYSSIAGLLGTGSSIQSTLKPGKHELYVEATDSQGLISTSVKMPFTVDTPQEVLLKVPGTNMVLYNQPLPSTYALNVNANGLTLQYSSSDSAVATVDGQGGITAIASGTALIDISSVELDAQNIPMYSTKMVVRVIDQVTDNTVSSALGINEIKEINVSPTSTPNIINMTNLPRGHYVLMLFDKQEKVLNSNFNAAIQVNGVDLSNRLWNNGGQQIILPFQIVTPGTSVDLNIVKGNNVASDALFKVALYPGVDVQDTNGYLNLTYWDQFFEPNDSMYIAKPLALEETISTVLSEQEAIDTFSFDVISGKSYSVSVTNNSGSFSYFTLGLGDYADTLKYANNTIVQPAKRSDLDFTATTTGKAIVTLSGITPFKSYQYTVSALPTTQDGLQHDKQTFEPNNTPLTAKPLKLQTMVTSKLTKDEKFDYYSFDVIAGQTYALELRNELTSATNLCYTVGSETVVDELVKVSCIGVGVLASTPFTATFTGTVVVGLHAYGYYQNVDYQLTVLPSTVDGLQQDPLTFEPNNTINTAAPISLDKTISSKLDSTEWGDVYSLDVVAGKTYTVDLTNSANSYSSIRLLIGNAASPTSIVNNEEITSGSRSVIDFVATTTETVYILLSSSIAYQNYDYGLTINSGTADGLQQDPLTFEPNNTINTAAPISLDKAISSKLDSTEWRDVYSLDVVAGKTYTVDLTNSANSYSSIRLLIGNAASPTSIVNNEEITSGSRSVIDFVATTTETVYILLSSSIAYQNYDYGLTINSGTADGLQQDPLTFEPNNTINTAAPISLDKTISSKLDVTEIQDVYSFNAVAGKTYTIDLRNGANSWAANLYSRFVSLNYKVGTSVSTNSYGAGNLKKGEFISISFTAQVDETIYLTISGASPYQNYDYSFSVLPAIKDGLLQNPITFEPNNSIATATPVAIGKEVTSKLDVTELQDIYSFDVAAGITYTLELKNGANSWTANLYSRFVSLNYKVGTSVLLDSYATGTLTKAEAVSKKFTSEIDQTIYLVISGAGEYKNYDYTFTLSKDVTVP